MDYYLLTKWIHILSSTVLFGTGMGTAFQMVAAMRSHNPHVIAGVAKNVVLADWIFTTPAGILQPLSGITLIYLNGWSLWEPWLLLTYALYVVAFACWAPVVWLQKEIRDIASEAIKTGEALPPKAHSYYRIWFALGWPAFIALMGVFWLMVAKPDF